MGCAHPDIAAALLHRPADVGRAARQKPSEQSPPTAKQMLPPPCSVTHTTEHLQADANYTHLQA